MKDMEGRPMVRTCCCAALLAAWAMPAFAWPATVIWPTYYRTGPDKSYQVMDEVFRGQTYEVLSCENDWCRVQDGRSIGYIEQAALARSDAPPPPPLKQGDCFDSQSAGFHKGGYFRYCEQIKQPTQ